MLAHKTAMFITPNTLRYVKEEVTLVLNYETD